MIHAYKTEDKIILFLSFSEKADFLLQNTLKNFQNGLGPVKYLKCDCLIEYSGVSVFERLPWSSHNRHVTMDLFKTLSNAF